MTAWSRGVRGYDEAMRTVVLGPRPAELEALVERRRALGQDLYDEVWEGEYHMAPAPHPWHGYLDQRLAVILEDLAGPSGLIVTGPFNLGAKDNFRVPDRGLHRKLPSTTFVPTAALVVEIVSPHDETWAKLGFYAEHGVDELLIVDPETRSVTWLDRGDDGYLEVADSRLLGVPVAQVADAIAWPDPD
jgi:Uma2 family endonuclease